MLTLLLALIGCTSPDLLAGPDGAPTPPSFHLTVGNAVAGAPMRLQVSGAPPGATVQLAYGSTGLGAGPCPAALSPSCLGMTGPLRLAALRLTVAADGTVSTQVPVPRANAGGHLTLQAVILQGGLVSNPVDRLVAAPGTLITGGADRDGDGFTPDEGDCADHAAAISPGAPDAAGDRYDTNCDDADGVDGDGDGVASVASGGPDCADADPAVFPGAPEACNGIDDDCDGQIEAGGTAPPGTVMFVTQVPTAGFTAVSSVFGNHIPSMERAPRGGDLMLRYPDGTLRNLTREAGFGAAGAIQGADAIAVREPTVHWDAGKALFSMVVGGTATRYSWDTFHWQIYEVSCLAPGQTASVRKVAGQPQGYNNVSPIYASDDRVIFTSDRPRSGEAHHYPPLDEYESAPTVTGLYALDERSGALQLLEHAPSGVFSPLIDARGMIVFSKWDHLQRDQQGDTPDAAASYAPLTWPDEGPGVPSPAWQGTEVFPEPRSVDDPDYDPAIGTHSFNHFLPWELRQDGTAEETLVHAGRHELGGSYVDPSFVDDASLTYVIDPSLHANQTPHTGDGGLMQLAQDAGRPTKYFATSAPEFYTAGGGRLMELTVPSNNADQLTMRALTDDADGTFRDPLPLRDGTLLASWTASTEGAYNLGTTEQPSWSYNYRLVSVGPNGAAGAPLTGAGIQRTATWWSPDVAVTWTGALWELDAVEVIARPRPIVAPPALPAVEQGVFDAAGVDPDALRAWMKERSLALIISRDVTQRDRADVQQPYNLAVPGGVSSIVAPLEGPIYDVAWLQIFQADAVRGYDGRDGRRHLARPMHEPEVSTSGGPEGSVAIGLDGSMAAFVPAGRALTWQLSAPDGEPVVRERNWLSFAPGEVRVCASCHGINTASQTGDPEPTNPPEALASLLAQWAAGMP